MIGYGNTFLIFLFSVNLKKNITIPGDGDKYERFINAIKDKSNQPGLEPPSYWREVAKLAVLSRERNAPIERVAKNSIFFIGDGMGVTSMTASRIYKGQRDDGLRFGEEAVLHMDTFPYSGASKTYCIDAQVADSSCSATAYLCGIKARFATAGVSPGVLWSNCWAQNNTKNHVSSVVEWAQKEGKSTGIVTTWRTTSIPMAASWAHIARRGWETDKDVRNDFMNPEICPDTGSQLISNAPGRKLNVLMGGGRQALLPEEEIDFESGQPGMRADGRNIVNEWLALKPQNETSLYITGRDQLLALDTSNVDNLFAAFAFSGLPWHEELEAHNDPTLEEMVEVAIKILSKNPKGYFLFVHADRIDSAHHRNYPSRSLREIVEFDKAVKKGDEITDDADTLLVVSADHSHTLGFSGYNVRGNPILKHSIIPAKDGFVFPTLFFANGPGPSWIDPDTGRRRNIIFDDVENPNYALPVPVPMGSESHGSEDVPIFAKGPYAHYFSGVHEQSTIPHLIAYATCTGDGLRNVHCNPADETSPTPTTTDDIPTTAATSTSCPTIYFYWILVLGLYGFVYLIAW